MNSSYRLLRTLSRNIRPFSGRIRCYPNIVQSRTLPRSRYSSTIAKTKASPVRLPLVTTTRVLLVAALLSPIFFLSRRRSAESETPKQLTDSSTQAPVYASKKDLEQAISELQAAIGEDAVSTDDEDLRNHGYSEWSTTNIDTLPVVVVYPASTEDVSKIARIATKYKCPMVPYSGGSSLEGNFSAPFGGISIDFAFMGEIIAVHADDMDVVVQPGVQYVELNQHLKSTGLFFPVDPGPSAKIGGMVGTGCSGTNAFRYGTMKDYVLNLTVVLSDGRVIKTRQRPRKSSAGYNLNGIFVGAEGTLGIVTEATLKLVAIPPATKVGIVTFPTIRDAAAAAMQVIRKGIAVGAMELLDDVQMMVINKAGATDRKWDEKPTLFFKFAGTPVAMQNEIDIITKITNANKGGEFLYARTDKEGEEIWKARKEALWSMLTMRREGDVVWNTDVAVPISRLPDIIEETKEQLDKLGLFASVLGHVGDGNFHTSIMYNPNNKSENDGVGHVVHHMVDTAIAMEGTCTGEHGIGIGKKESLIDELGPETIHLMRTFKRSVDPLWIMNPGKVFDAVAAKPTKH